MSVTREYRHEAMRPWCGDDCGLARNHGAGWHRAALLSDQQRALWAGIPWLGNLVHQTAGADANPGALPDERQHAPGTGSSDGSFVGFDSRREPGSGLGFTDEVEPGGYAWWYVDALSDDRRYGLTIIAFVGSVFSPYYAFARRRGNADPEQHCAINVALYGASGKRWAMTERGRSALTRTLETFTVGPSSLYWEGSTLTIRVDETTFPFPGRLRGVVRVRPRHVLEQTFGLDSAGRHRWRPIAPLARAEVEFEEPSASWCGSAYFDHNAGCEPLEAGFRSWNWSRTSGGTMSEIYYDTTPRVGPPRSVAVAITEDGQIERRQLPTRQPLPATLWRIARGTHGDDGSAPRVVETLEDTPFYARSLVETHVAGTPLTLFHESLDLDRFANPVVQCMLACRMPRRAHWQR